MANQPSRLPPPASRRPGTAAAIVIWGWATAAHAQLDILQPPPDLPGLADAPLLQLALLENPVPMVIVTLVVALGAYAMASRLDRRKPGLMIAGGALLLGLTGIVVATLVQTDREAVQERTRETVAAVAEADAERLSAIFDPEVRLYYSGLTVGWNRGRILSFIDVNLLPGSQYQVESHRVGQIQTQIGPGRFTARSRATVIVTPTGNRNPTRVICLMTWRQDPDTPGPEGWALTEIQPLWIQGIGEVDSRVMPRGF